jgi:membrane-associated protease RseP (regulator of RpoE activity)
MSQSRDTEQSIAALERIVKLHNRPLLVEKAEADLDTRSIAALQARLAPLGAELIVEAAPFDNMMVVPVLYVKLGDKWRGTPDDLRGLAQLRRQLYFKLEGKAVDDNVARLFESKERLAFVQFLHSRVTTKAVDDLKAKHRDAIVYVFGQALLGVNAGNHPSGALVIRVEPGTAAAGAGILAGDVITSMDGHALPDFDRLTARIAEHEPGDSVEVEVLRGTERTKLSVTLGSRPSEE